MAALLDKLFNVDFLTIKPEQLKDMGEVTSLAIYESNSKVYDPKGLFSETIFGTRDTQLRMLKPGYIDLKMPIIHPFAYKILISLDPIFDKILSGKIKASFNTELGTFIEDPKGSTGYEFFMQNIHKVQFTNSDSKSRSVSIEVVLKALRPENLIRYFYVLPAGLRDIEEDSKGRPTQDEINNLYSRMIMAVNGIRNNTIRENNYANYDPYRYRVQLIALDVFEYIKNILEGKRGFIQSKWASRGLMDGTRNVLTALPNVVSDLKDPNKISFNDTTVGLYQFVKSIMPLAVHEVHKYFIIGVANPMSNNVKVIDSKTLKTTFKTANAKDKEAWTTAQGLNNIFNKLRQDVVKNDYAKLGEDYIALVEDKGKDIYVVKDTNNIPKEVNVNKLRPITYGELLYISVAKVSKQSKATVTRYPVINLGSIYPSGVYLKSTAIGRRVKVHLDTEVLDLPEYPKDGEKYFGSVSSSVYHLQKLDGDFDGDCLLGLVHMRYVNKKVPKVDIIDRNINNTNKEQIMPMSDKYRITYSNGLINLKDFPREELIKTEGNKEYYKVPENVEVLTMWEGELKWVHPESFSIHKNLTMLNVKTYKGATLQCSNDHSLITLDEHLNYIRANPEIGMVMPKLKNSFDKYVRPGKLKYTIQEEGVEFKLNFDLGYLFGVMIGDGWVNNGERSILSKDSEVILSTGHDNIISKVSEILKSYGCESNSEYKRSRHTWHFKPVAKLLHKYIGHSVGNKQLPSFWTNTSSGYRWGLYSGLIDTNGTITISAMNRMTVGYSTTSQKLAYDISGLIHSLGMSSSVTASQRKTGTIEYSIRSTLGTFKRAKGKLKLLNENKAKNLELIHNHLDNVIEVEYTPTLPLYRLQELRTFLNNQKDNASASKVSNVIKVASEVYGGSFPKHVILDIITAYPYFFKKDDFWSKYKDMVLDETIEWVMIKEVTPLPEITEAYDLTCPPHCTFVMENGIVVYDTVSFNTVLTKESVNEIDKIFNSKSFYIMPNGTLTYSVSTDTLEFVLKSLSK